MFGLSTTLGRIFFLLVPYLAFGEPLVGDPLAGDPLVADPLAGDPLAGDPLLFTPGDRGGDMRLRRYAVPATGAAVTGETRGPRLRGGVVPATFLGTDRECDGLPPDPALSFPSLAGESWMDPRLAVGLAACCRRFLEYFARIRDLGARAGCGCSLSSRSSSLDSNVSKLARGAR